jgi:hypothetical protein
MLPQVRPGQSLVLDRPKPVKPDGYVKPILHPITKVPLAGTGVTVEVPTPQTLPPDINPTTGVILAGKGETATVVTASKNDVTTTLPNIVPKHGRKSRFLNGQWVALISLLGAGASIYAVARTTRR